MAIVFPMPANTRPFVTQTVFTAPLILVGGVLVYDFSGATQHAVVLSEILPNSAYFLSTLSIGGDLDASDYLNAIQEVPLLTLERGSDRNAIMERPFSVVGLSDAGEIGVWLRTQRGNDSVLASITGILKQTANLVGRTAVSLSFAFTVFAVDEGYYVRSMQEAAEMSAMKGR
jgi:hypothetical protein